MVLKEIGILSVLLLISCVWIESKSIRSIRSDSIETYYPEPTNTKSGFDENPSLTTEDNPKKPGWMRTQLMRFGDITSRVSNSLGGTAMKVTAIIEKLCKMLKTVIPIVAAVCNVGQFQFCTSADAPIQLGEAMNNPLSPMDLNAPDK